MRVLEAERLKKRYRSMGRVVEAVRGISLRIEAGEILAFLGPNGAGKTTTIKIIAGLIMPDAGTVRVMGEDPHQNSRALRHVGAVLEGNRNIYWRLTALENLIYFGMLKGLSEKDARTRGTLLLERFELGPKRNMLVQTLSRGMQQKVAIAVALIHEPMLLLLDEPTLGLDVEAAESMKQLLQDIAAEGRAVLLTTHQLNIAQQLSSRVAVIREGEIVAEQPTKELIRQFSGNTYTIEVRDPLAPETIEKLKTTGAAVTAEKIVYSGDDSGLYKALSVLEPLPLVRVEQDQSDLTAIFLKLIKEPGHA
jgi:ABC-2 type transport system ATP-binding protein